MNLYNEDFENLDVDNITISYDDEKGLELLEELKEYFVDRIEQKREELDEILHLEGKVSVKLKILRDIERYQQKLDILDSYR